MPTKLNRRVVRETTDQLYSKGRYRPVIIELEAGGSILKVRLAGERTRYSLTYKALYQLAVKVQVDSERYAKWKAKDAKRKAAQKAGAA